MTYTILGWIGSLFFAICGVPQAYMSYKNKNSDGMSWLFLIFWSLGNIFTFAYVILTEQIPLIANYMFNFLILLVIIRYKIKWPLVHQWLRLRFQTLKNFFSCI
jgi:uncharacterized protein with PQ loop repeat